MDFIEYIENQYLSQFNNVALGNNVHISGSDNFAHANNFKIQGNNNYVFTQGHRHGNIHKDDTLTVNRF